jgi:hypothetical protein
MAAATRCLYHKKAPNDRTMHENNAIVMLLPMVNSRRLWVRIAQALGCLLFIANPLVAQNLVPNPSFEDVDECPYEPPLLGFMPNARPLHWFTSTDSPDYFNACIDSVTSVPSNYVVYQHALNGEAYVGMYTYSTLFPETREVVSAPLLAPLEVGQTYFASLYANAGFGGTIHWPTRATNNIGVLFTTEPYVWQDPMPPFGIRDFAHVRSAEVISDTVGWTLVSGSFVADSAYRYIVLGNHYSDALTEVEVLDADTLLGQYTAYTLIDLLCVSPNPEGCPLANGFQGHQPSGVGISPNPASDDFVVRFGSSAWQELVVRDALGRTLLDTGIKGRIELQLNVSDWAKGAYFLTVSSSREERTLRFAVW